MSAKESAIFLMYGRDPVNKLSTILNAPRRYLGDVTGPPTSWLRSKTKTTETFKHLDPPECNLAKINKQNTILEVKQVQTATKAGFGWQAVLLLTIAVNLLTTLFLCFRL